MAKETAFENGRISNFEGVVTLTLDQVILHTVVQQPLTYTHRPNFIEIKESFCGQTYVCTDGYLRPAFIRSTQKSRPKNVNIKHK